MNRHKLVTTLQQIRALVDESLYEVGHSRAERENVGKRETERKPETPRLTFNMNVLAFMNKYARGLKGPQKFTLLLAWLVFPAVPFSMKPGN